jgi:hypothetical protein
MLTTATRKLLSPFSNRSAGRSHGNRRSNKREHPHGSRLRIETLEDRRVLSALTEVALDGSSNLTVADIAPEGKSDTLTISSDAVNNVFVISDPNNLITTSIPGAAGDGTNSVTVPFASVPGAQILVNTLAGDDTISVAGLDSGGKGLSIDGGAGTDAASFQTTATNLGAGSLSVTADTIALDAAVTAAGASLSATSGVTLSEPLTTGAGGLSVNADSDGDGSGTFTLSPAVLGGWSQQARVTASDWAASDQFGVSVAVDGGTAVVGAYQHDVNSNSNQGAA